MSRLFGLTAPAAALIMPSQVPAAAMRARPLSLLAARAPAPALGPALPGRSAQPNSAAVLPGSRRWATKRTAGGTQNTKDSAGKHLGLKCTSGTPVDDGVIIVRQRGTKFRPGFGVGIGRDHTLFATRQGVVRFWYDLPRDRHYVCVDDGSLPTPIMPSKDEAKRRLASMVNLEKYMELRGEDRHRYIMQLVRQYDEDLRKEVHEVAERWISGEMIGASKDSELASRVQGRRMRRMNLVDLTKL